MNLNFSDEQKMLREQIQKFCESDYSFEKREEIIKSGEGFDRDFWNLFQNSVGYLYLSMKTQADLGTVQLNFQFYSKNLERCLLSNLI